MHTVTTKTEIRPAALDRINAARYLSVSPNHFDKVVADAGIERVSLLRKFVYRVADLDALLGLSAANDNGEPAGPGGDYPEADRVLASLK